MGCFLFIIMFFCFEDGYVVDLVKGGGGICYLVVEILVIVIISYLCYVCGIVKLFGFELIYKVIKSY